MTTTTNIQMANGSSDQRASNKSGNEFEEMATMTTTNHIQDIIKNNTKILAGLMVGGMIAIAAILPGSVLGSPSTEGSGSSVITSVGMEFPNVDDYDSLIPDVKAAITWESPETDDYGSLPPRVMVYAAWESPSTGDYASLPSRVKAFAAWESP